MKSYFTNMATDTAKFIEKKGGLSYLSWATAVSLAGNPEHAPVLFGTQPYLEVFGGAVVAIDMMGQRIWLPVLDERNNPVSLGNLTSRDIGDAIQRCRAKAVAMTAGIGMSLYAGFDGDAGKFVADLGIRPDTDLAAIKAITSKKGGSSNAEYLDWGSALAAAKATDENFKWEIGMYPFIDSTTGEIADKPFLKTGRTFMVSVKVDYKGKTHIEWLPVMGILPVQTKYGVKKMDHQPLITPNVFDWNRSIMRCLAKAISVVSGYGLSIYAKEDLLKGDAGNPGDAGTGSGVDAPDLTEVRKLLKEAGKDEAAMCAWLGVKSLEDADQEAISKAETTLRKGMGKSAPTPTPPPAPAKKEVEEPWPV